MEFCCEFENVEVGLDRYFCNFLHVKVSSTPIALSSFTDRHFKQITSRMRESHATMSEMHELRR